MSVSMAMQSALGGLNRTNEWTAGDGIPMVGRAEMVPRKPTKRGKRRNCFLNLNVDMGRTMNLELNSIRC